MSEVKESLFPSKHQLPNGERTELKCWLHLFSLKKKKKLILVLNDMMVNKWQQIYIFGRTILLMTGENYTDLSTVSQLIIKMTWNSKWFVSATSSVQKKKDFSKAYADKQHYCLLVAKSVKQQCKHLMELKHELSGMQLPNIGGNQRKRKPN